MGKPSGGPKTGKAKILAAQRREEVLELRLTGMSQRSIAAEVGITPGRVAQILKQVLEESAATSRGLAATFGEMELLRLDRLLQVPYAKALGGSLGGIDRCLSLIAQRIKRLGSMLRRNTLFLALTS